MTGDKLDGSRELSRLLSSLGAESAPPRDAALESERAARLALHLDRDLARLVQRRRVVRLSAPLAAAAAALLALGGWYHTRSQDSSSRIEQEPLRLPQKSVPALPPVPSVPALPSARPTSPPREVSPLRSVTPPVTSAAPVASVAASTLGEENRLFEAAARSTREGNVDGALGELDELLGQYPKSPLAQGALVRKFRLLASAGRNDQAADAARRYLELYPTGFAITEASALVRGATPSGPTEQP